VKTCHGLRARATSRSNSSGVSESASARAFDRVSGDVDLQVADLQLLRLGLVAAPQARPDPATSSCGLNGLTT
jgi:hypothetical protein